VPEELMFQLYDRAGGVPRYVLQRPADLIQDIDPGDLKVEEVIQIALERIGEAIKQINNFNELMRCLTDNANFVQYSNRLIHRWPEVPSYKEHHVQWASIHIYNEVQKRLEDETWSKLLHKVQDRSNPSSARGIMFESYVLQLFKTGGHKFETRRLQNSKVRFCVSISDSNRDVILMGSCRIRMIES
jgi:hypothetical protein